MTWLWANIYSIMFVFCYIFWRKSRRRRGCLAVLFFFLHSCLFFFRNILEQYVFKTTLCIIFLSLSSSYLFSSIIFWRTRSSGCLAGLSIRRRLVYSPPTGLLCCGESLQPWSRSTLGPCNLPQCLCRERKRDWQGVPKKTHIQNGGLTWEAVRPQDKNGRTDPRAFWDSYHYDQWGSYGQMILKVRFFWDTLYSKS